MNSWLRATVFKMPNVLVLEREEEALAYAARQFRAA